MNFTNNEKSPQDDIAIIIKNLELHIKSCQHALSRFKYSDSSNGLSFSEVHDILSELMFDTEEMSDLLGEWNEEHGSLDEDDGDVSDDCDPPLDIYLVEYLETDSTDWD